jgi:hypothetical protein
MAQKETLRAGWLDRAVQALQAWASDLRLYGYVGSNRVDLKDNQISQNPLNKWRKSRYHPPTNPSL